MTMATLLAVARGEHPADLVLRGARIANVFTLEYEEAEVALWKGRIAGIGKGYRGAAEEDLSGLVLAPGFFDGHCHIESTLLTPAAFSEPAAVRGTAAVAADPHEIANTCGLAGVEYLWREGSGCPVTFFGPPPPACPRRPSRRPSRPWTRRLWRPVSPGGGATPWER